METGQSLVMIMIFRGMCENYSHHLHRMVEIHNTCRSPLKCENYSHHLHRGPTLKSKD